MRRALGYAVLWSFIPALLFPATLAAHHEKKTRSHPTTSSRVSQPPVIFSIEPSATTIAAGQSVTFTISGNNFSSGTVSFSWTGGGGTSASYSIWVGGSSSTTQSSTSSTRSSSTSSYGQGFSWIRTAERNDAFTNLALTISKAFHGRILERGRQPQFTLIHGPPRERERAFFSCFISFSSKDEAIVRKLWADLQRHGVSCWFAPEDLPIGQPIRVGIDERVRHFEKVFLVLSEHSISSQWVEEEVEAALEEERKRGVVKLFPVRIDAAVMNSAHGWPAYVRRTRNIGDLTLWADSVAYEHALARILRDLRKA